MEPENSEEEDDAPVSWIVRVHTEAYIDRIPFFQVILSGKMTLSLINMDFIEKDATGTVAVGGTHTYNSCS